MGTAVVWEGHNVSPTVLVLDPAREHEHGELPPQWRELVPERQVVWCRLSNEQALPEAGRLLAEPDALGRPIDVVTCGSVPSGVHDLVRDHAGPIRSLLLVDPDEQDARDVEVVEGVEVRTVGSPRWDRPLHGADVRKEVEAAIAALDEARAERRAP